jgi:general secretion pathway protein I
MSRVVRLRRRSPGFTLLEAIVALVIFSMGSIALYSWLGVNVKTLLRVQALRESVAMSTSALESIRGINPMAAPRGRRQVGELVVEWEARPVEPVRNAVTQLGIPTVFQVELFLLDVRVLRGTTEVDRFQVRQVGYHQARALEEE